MSLDFDSTTSSTTGKRYAFIVGTEDHDESDFRALSGTFNDVRQLKKLLTKFGYIVKVKFDGSARDALESLEHMCNEVQMEDTILFFFTGHGVKSTNGLDLHMIMSSTKKDRLRATSLLGSQVNDILSETKSKRQLMFLDCCNGAAFARSIRSNSISGGRIIMASSNEAEPAYEVVDKDGELVGLFTSILVEGIKSERAAFTSKGCLSSEKSQKKIVTALSLYQYCQSAVESHYSSKKQSLKQNTMLWSLGLDHDFTVLEYDDVL